MRGCCTVDYRQRHFQNARIFRFRLWSWLITATTSIGISVSPVCRFFGWGFVAARFVVAATSGGCCTITALGCWFVGPFFIVEGAASYGAWHGRWVATIPEVSGCWFVSPV